MITPHKSETPLPSGWDNFSALSAGPLLVECPVSRVCYTDDTVTIVPEPLAPLPVRYCFPGYAARHPTRFGIGLLPIRKHASGPDSFAVHQLPWNLPANAIKLSRDRHPSTITLDGDARGAEVVYFVRAKGAGVDPVCADRIF